MKVLRAKELAAEINAVGKSRVRLVDSSLEEISKAITREDIKNIIVSGGIVVIPEKGTSRGRARVRHARKKLGRYRNKGRKKGTIKARTP
ncbi:MAG: 50S ribosomal protein L19e, partial [Candidatus Diapherotrites archaeon]|nr:50S ribosomal protein L19e [Candidatus Diapherotrites archaeon]